MEGSQTTTTHDLTQLHSHKAFFVNLVGWEVLDHPSYNPNLAPSDYHLFTDLEKWLGGQRFDSNDELKSSVADWVSTQERIFYNMGIEKLVPRYDKCLNNGGDYVETVSYTHLKGNITF